MTVRTCLAHRGYSTRPAKGVGGVLTNVCRSCFGLVRFLKPGGFERYEASSVSVRMAEAISHRRPDDAGVWLDSKVGIPLAHRGFAVKDLARAGHQPTWQNRVFMFGSEFKAGGASVFCGRDSPGSPARVFSAQLRAGSVVDLSRHSQACPRIRRQAEGGATSSKFGFWRNQRAIGLSTTRLSGAGSARSKAESMTRLRLCTTFWKRR